MINGATQETVFDIIQFYLNLGLTVKGAIQEVESITGKLPDTIVDMIKIKFG